MKTRSGSPATSRSRHAHAGAPGRAVPAVPPVLERIVLSGTVVSIATTVTLALLARAERRRPLQPVNSTSHWYMGERAGRSRAFDLPRTVGGYLTHHAASVFWAGVFEAVRRLLPNAAPLRDAGLVSALAAIVDYGLMPRRLTPGWEKVLTPRSIALTYAIMALALAVRCGGASGRSRERRGVSRRSTRA